MANCSIRTAFALYAAVALLAALVLSFVTTGLLGLLANATLPDDLLAHSGTYVLDADAGQLVPAEALSWYETSAVDAAVAPDGQASERDGEPVVLYVESAARPDAAPVSLADPPADVRDAAVTDLTWAISEDGARTLSLAEIPAYDAAAASERPGAEAAAELAASLPPNADGARPVVSNVGYYLPHPGDPEPYRTIANLAIASVPVVFVACLAVAGRLFYRRRLAGPINAMGEAAERIAASDLDFRVPPQRADELGRLCARFEDMRAELERSERELWLAAENRRRVNAAFAHDLRTPLTVVRGQAELIGRLAADGAVREAAAAITRQAERLSAYADSMRDLDTLDATTVSPAPLDLRAWFAQAAADAREVARAAGVELAVASEGLPERAEADAAALARVADNLVANAARHARATVRLSASWSDGTLTLTVADDGPGFSEAALAHAAEPFWSEARRDAARDGAPTDGSHLGLGLYVCALLAERHGGELRMANAPEGGAVAAARFSAPVKSYETVTKR